MARSTAIPRNVKTKYAIPRRRSKIDSVTPSSISVEGICGTGERMAGGMRDTLGLCAERARQKRLEVSDGSFTSPSSSMPVRCQLLWMEHKKP